MSDLHGDVVFPHLSPGKYWSQTGSDWVTIGGGLEIDVDATCRRRVTVSIGPVLAALLDAEGRR